MWQCVDRVVWPRGVHVGYFWNRTPDQTLTLCVGKKEFEAAMAKSHFRTHLSSHRQQCQDRMYFCSLVQTHLAPGSKTSTVGLHSQCMNIPILSSLLRAHMQCPLYRGQVMFFQTPLF